MRASTSPIKAPAFSGQARNRSLPGQGSPGPEAPLEVQQRFQNEFKVSGINQL